MTDAELPAILRRTQQPYPTDFSPASTYCDALRQDVKRLLAEVERLRAELAMKETREATMLEVAQDVARAFNLRSIIVVGRDERHVVATLPRRAIDKARALLAAQQHEPAAQSGEGSAGG